MKEWFKRLLAGMAIGAGSAVPGVSGGTIAVIFRVYEKFLWAISNIVKEFKKAFMYLLPMVIGIVLGMLPMIVIMDKALEGFTFGVICIFAGYIIGSLPLLRDEVKEVKPRVIDWVVFSLALLVAVGLGVASCFVSGNVADLFINTPIWFYFVILPVGIVASIALAVPGISGGMILIILGFYRPLIDTTVDTAKNCLAGDWSNFGHQLLILTILFVGVVIGFFITSKLMNYLLGKYRLTTFYSIIGFVVGGVVALFINFEIYEYYKRWASGGQGYLPLYVEIPIGIVLLFVVMILSYLLVKKQRQIKQEENVEKID